jgi:protein kinase X
MKHRWFKHIDWQDVYYKKLKPPVLPKVSYDGDTRNFDDYPEGDWKNKPPALESEAKLFEDF